MFLLEYLQHRLDCRFKQSQRAAKIRALPGCHGPFSVIDRETINKPIENLVLEVHKDAGRADEILNTYAKVAVRAHEKTNCLTEVMIPSAEQWLKDGSINLSGPLAGIPVSLKDTVDVARTGGMTKLLKDAGAVPYVNTNVPVTLLSFESSNDVWGRSTNPYNSKYAPGGSTGGEGALLALGGRTGIGSDVAGSVRCPAHYSGIYSLKCFTGRWMKLGASTSMPGQDGVPSVYSPMARTLDDLTYFTRSIIWMKPWTYDYSVHPLPWRSEIEQEILQNGRPRVGVFRTDGVVDPSPACRRALEMAETALRNAGHEIVEINPPSPYKALQFVSHLLCSDGLKTVHSFFRRGESNDPGVVRMRFYMRLPRPIKYLHYLWDVHEYWQLIAKREAYKRRWFEWWEDAKIDFLIAPPNALPAVPHNGMHDAASSCGYTFLFNLIDYSAGVMPVTHVDKEKDQLPSTFDIKRLNGIARGAYKLYDAEDMHGLPVGVQVVGRRLEEEKVLAAMKRVEDALGGNKSKFIDLD
ncbi:hypothetical protein TrVGV298_003649 [Trichoderma virens]|nr:hypothetical protein TrVGV298_003649 [Trichoderma virens]